MINHLLLQPLAGTARQSVTPWVEENGIMAQVIGGEPSLISDLINLIKAPSLVALRCFLRPGCNRRRFFFPKMILQEEKKSAAEAKEKSIQQSHVYRGGLFSNVIQHCRGCAVLKGCFLIAQLEMAFVKSKFYLFKMAPWLSPKMHGMLRIKTKNAINSPSRRSGEITDKVLSIIHTVPNLARINVCLHCSPLSFVCRSWCGAKLAPHVAHYNQV